MSEHGGVRNPFNSDQAARRYAGSRPYYHRSALDLAMIQQPLRPARLAIDVGCGTGLSSVAVADLADRVVAIDASAAMLRAAQDRPGIKYLVAAAERIPLRDGAADLATVGGAFHWFDQPPALAELARVLRAGAHLIVYSDFFHGRLKDQPGFVSWLTGSYLPRYPSPVRHAQFDPDAAARAGFGQASVRMSEYDVPFTSGEMADYLLSQSNAAAAIESGTISASLLRDQIIKETAAFFTDDERAVFGLRVWTAVRLP
jgi:SAM-dependent methyltransferase